MADWAFLLKEDGDFLLKEDGDRIILDDLLVRYRINSGSFLDGVFADWRRAIKRVNSDGTIDYQPWAFHTWRLEKMTAAVFEELQLLQGSTLASLLTNNINARNSSATYTNAVMGLVNGQHQGTRVLNVNIEFRVDVS